MKQIHAEQITEAVAQLCMQANYFISPDIERAFQTARQTEADELSQGVLDKLMENARIAAAESIPICQDTGMAVVFAELGQNAHVTGGSLSAAIQAGVAKGYCEGYLRKSVVLDPIDRVNTQNNTPAVIHYTVVEGETLKLTVAPKGFGSENMSALAMLKPSQGIVGVKAFVVDTIKKAGANPCPPIIVGIGVGGTMEKAALMAKQALLREVGSRQDNPFWAGIEAELLHEINALRIGPAGLGGKTTALAVHIGTYPTHIAGLPVAVNIGCHVTRHAQTTL